jgi:activator of HSP90 ATPase
LIQRKEPSSSFTLPPPERKKDDNIVKTTVVEHSFEFRGEGYSARHIYESLLNPKRANIWTHGRAQVSKKVGSEFRFFDGNVHGQLLQAVSFLSSKRLNSGS